MTFKRPSLLISPNIGGARYALWCRPVELRIISCYGSVTSSSGQEVILTADQLHATEWEETPHRLNINWRANTCWKEKKLSRTAQSFILSFFLSWDKICIKQALNLLCLSVWLLEQLTWLSGIQYMSQLVQHFYVSAQLTETAPLFVFNYPSCRCSEPNLTAWRSFSAPCRVFMTWPGDPPRLIPIYTVKIAKFLNFWKNHFFKIVFIYVCVV